MVSMDPAPSALLLPIEFYVIRRDDLTVLYEYRWMGSSYKSSSVFGKRLREARLALDIPQDRLGVLAGLDEGTASARISRYESGVHEPPVSFAERLAKILHVPAAYFYASDDTMAALILDFHNLSKPAKQKVLSYIGSLK